MQQDLTEQLEPATHYSLLNIRINEFFLYNYYWFDQNSSENMLLHPYLFTNTDYEEDNDTYTDWPGYI